MWMLCAEMGGGMSRLDSRIVLGRGVEACRSVNGIFSFPLVDVASNAIAQDSNFKIMNRE